eukprot:TRINITY_DN2394_c0_g1_i12.p1 TRINITY_DN2394_c0_g1~~TRINITY_DN2394_c0_g1_i12.p1  ORF type:complete len:496 (+),score=188.04 TRINITY_DN2394_c0_g1_i12:269-1756(+)
MLMRTQKEVATDLQDQLKAHTTDRLVRLKKMAADVAKLQAGVEAAKPAAAPAAAAPRSMDKRVPMKVREPAERTKDFKEVALGYTKEEAMEEAKRCFNCRKPMCMEGCPCALPIPEYIAAIKAGDFNKAFGIITTKNPLIRSCGRVCPHMCEAKCIRGKKGEPLAIEWLKRAAGEFATPTAPTPATNTGKKVAIVGSGPAGLVAAWHLRLAGHAVTVFEQKGVAGGMMALCIPPYRLPRDALEADVARVKALGVEIRLNTRVDSIDALFSQGYNAVFLGLGTLKPKKLGIPGEEAEGVEHVIPFLEAVNVAGRTKVGKKVAVVGAGFSAMDAVRTARRLGSEAFIVYRRMKEQMPASADEVKEAEEEGVVMHVLTNPTKVVVVDGKVAGLELQKQKLGAPDSSGRPAPEAIPGSEFTLACDMVIQAISQEPELGTLGASLKTTKWNTIDTDPATGKTSRAAVWAAGDAATGPKTIIEGVTGTMKAVASILEFLKN